MRERAAKLPRCEATGGARCVYVMNEGPTQNANKMSTHKNCTNKQKVRRNRTHTHTDTHAHSVVAG